jgi:adenylyltransferase/sulfurtransferase
MAPGARGNFRVMSPFSAFAADGVLTPEETRRYARQLTLSGFGADGQRRLKAATALLVGAGGLGSPAALYLAAAGIGRIVIVEFDDVDVSNLQRQILFGTDDIGRPKGEAARQRLRALNPHVQVDLVSEPFSARNGRALVAAADVVLDGSDNFPTRYLVNDACVLEGTPNVFGSIRGFEGQVSVFATAGGPCYRCLHPEPPPDGLIPSCAEAGVLGVLPGVVGALQATEAIKVVAGVGAPLVGRLLVYDAWRMRARDIVLPRDVSCPVCGDDPSIVELAAYDAVACSTSADGDLVEGDVAGTGGFQIITVAEYGDWLAAGRSHVLIDVREPEEHALGAIDGARLMPLGTIDQQASRLPHDRPVVVHCRTGHRSARAALLLRRQGIDARSLAGGFEAWGRARSH